MPAFAIFNLYKIERFSTINRNISTKKPKMSTNSSVILESKLDRLIETIDSRITETKNDIDEVDKMFETFLAEMEKFRKAVEEENS